MVTKIAKPSHKPHKGAKPNAPFKKHNKADRAKGKPQK